jgi:hypothetical protein
MTLKEIYRIALARGLTAKQAGAEFNVRHNSLAKMKAKHNLPSLITEYESSDRKSMQSLSDKDLESFIKTLEKSNHNDNKEYKYATDERALRAKRNQKVLR